MPDDRERRDEQHADDGAAADAVQFSSSSGGITTI
jgi:hypothetical protein